MKLLNEACFDIKPVVEYIQEGENKVKNYFLTGTYMQSEGLNKNGRIYPKPILEKELERYQSLIGAKRALGELGHPDSPTINLPLVSHLITNLKFEGNNVTGKAKILETPNGKIVRNFIDNEILLGMSSRGIGSVKQEAAANYVQDDFRLATIDIVAEPSAPEAFVTGILEGKEWLLVDGVWQSYEMEKSKKLLERVTTRDIENVALLIFENYLARLRL